MPIISRFLSKSRLVFPRERLSCDLSLYLVANRPSFSDEHLFVSRIQDAVRGGVSCVQLRDYASDYRASVKMAWRLRAVLKDVPLFINTPESIRLAREVDAAGVYFEEDVSYIEARECLGKKMVIGVPVKNMDELVRMGKSDAIDYLSVKVFPSRKTCPKNDLLWGVDGLKEIRRLSPHRIIAIGGLDLTSVELIYKNLRDGDGIAMAGGLMAVENPCLTAQKIQTIRKNIRR